MSLKLIKSLSTLIKVEKGHIADLQPTLQDLNDQLQKIDERLDVLTDKVEKEKAFLKNELTTVDFIVFLDRIEKEKLDLLRKRDHVLSEYEVIHSQVMEHVKSEKAYAHIQNRLKDEEKEKLEKQEEDIIEDITQMRVFYGES